MESRHIAGEEEAVRGEGSARVQVVRQHARPAHRQAAETTPVGLDDTRLVAGQKLHTTRERPIYQDVCNLTARFGHPVARIQAKPRLVRASDGGRIERATAKQDAAIRGKCGAAPLDGEHVLQHLVDHGDMGETDARGVPQNSRRVETRVEAKRRAVRNAAHDLLEAPNMVQGKRHLPHTATPHREHGVGRFSSSREHAPGRRHRLRLARRARREEDERSFLVVEQVRFSFRKMGGLENRIALGAHDDAPAALEPRHPRKVVRHVVHKRFRPRFVDATRHANARAFQIEQARKLLRRCEAIVQHDERERPVPCGQGEKDELRTVRKVDRDAVAAPDPLAPQTTGDCRRREPGLAIGARMLRAVARDEHEEDPVGIQSHQAFERIDHREFGPLFSSDAASATWADKGNGKRPDTQGIGSLGFRET